MSSRVRAIGLSLLRWVDADAARAKGRDVGIDWLGLLPFLAIHGMCLGVLFVGWSPVAVGVCVLLFVTRMFFVTAFYHRYFSHRTFKTNRFWQAVFAVLGMTAAQKGPLWWAAHHRAHHKHSDTERDAHSPVAGGFWWSQVGWVLDSRSVEPDRSLVTDLSRFPELRFLDRFNVIVPVLLGIALYALGAWLERVHPALGTSGLQLLIWGFFVSTTVLFHAVSSINSLAHLWGSRRYGTRDGSRNNFLLALITLGEGWHNNHHHYQASCRQGFYWWELDLTWYAIEALARLGIVWDVRGVPRHIRERRLSDPRTQRAA